AAESGSAAQGCPSDLFPSSRGIFFHGNPAPTVFGIGSSCPWRRRARRCVRAAALPVGESYPARWRRTKRGLCQHQETNLRIMICRCVVLSSKSQHPKPKEAPIFKLQPITSHVFGGWSLEFLWCLVLTVAAGSNVAIPET